MHKFLLLLIVCIFSIYSPKIFADPMIDTIFITSTDPDSGRTLMIEEDRYSIWVYVLNPDMKGIDFEGFLCSTVNPDENNLDAENALEKGYALPITKEYASSYSFIENLNTQDIKIRWKNSKAEISINKKLYMILDLKDKKSYSRGVAKDGPYGYTFKI